MIQHFQKSFLNIFLIIVESYLTFLLSFMQLIFFRIYSQLVCIMKIICKLLKVLQDKTIFYVIEKFSFLINN